MSSRHSQQLAAIAAIAEERYQEAAAIVDALREEQPRRNLQRGICRYCSCSEARGCGILVDHGPEFQPSVFRCGWADADCTVCTNVSCLGLWRREAPAEMDVAIHDLAESAARSSRIVLP